MRLVGAALLVAIAGAIWLLLPVQHWPGYTSGSLLSSSLGWSALPIIMIPVLLTGFSGYGLWLWSHGHVRIGAGVWSLGVMVLILTNMSHALGPFFLPAALMLIIGAIKTVWRWPFLRA